MKTITVAELRQNPTPALDAVAGGASLTVTKHRRPVAMLVPAEDDAPVRIQPAVNPSPSQLAARPRPSLHSYEETESLLDEMASEW
ncbi:hypothetical protein GCM10028820_14390 [Tessaracoccus terricola]